MSPVSGSGAAATAVVEAVASGLQTWSGPGRVFVGYSGGLDSAVLLHAASVCRPGQVTALHVNHGLHPDADAWDVHCQAQCAELGVPLLSQRAAVARHGNLEAAARHARYEFFASELGAEDVLLLAHHRDDQVETVLLRLLQGRGFYGMPGQRWLRVGSSARAKVVRPLLHLPRAVLAAYAERFALLWVEDPSNADLNLDRNFVRHRLLVDLRERWPDLDRSLLDVLKARETADAALLAALALGDRCVSLQRLPGETGAAAEALRIWLASLGEPLPTRAALRDFVAQLSSPRDRQPALTVGSGALRRFRDHVYHVPAPPVLAGSYPVDLPTTLQLPHGRLVVARGQQGFAPAANMVVKFVAGVPGASIVLRGHRHRVRELLHRAAVPPWCRDTYPLLVDAEGVAAVPGIACRDAAAGSAADRYQCEWSEIVELH